MRVAPGVGSDLAEVDFQREGSRNLDETGEHVPVSVADEGTAGVRASGRPGD